MLALIPTYLEHNQQKFFKNALAIFMTKNLPLATATKGDLTKMRSLKIEEGFVNPGECFF